MRQLLVAMALVCAACAGPQTRADVAPPVPALAAPAKSPTDVTGGFYNAYRTLPPGGGIPDAKARAAIEPYITPALDQLLIAAAGAEDEYATATRHKSPPLWEGDIFTSNFEGVTSVGNPVCNWSGAKGTCDVMLTYDDKSGRPVSWTDKVMLVENGADWRIDDIAYGATWDFGNKGTLRENLKEVIEEAKKAP